MTPAHVEVVKNINIAAEKIISKKSLHNLICVRIFITYASKRVYFLKVYSFLFYMLLC